MQIGLLWNECRLWHLCTGIDTKPYFTRCSALQGIEVLGFGAEGFANSSVLGLGRAFFV